MKLLTKTSRYYILFSVIIFIGGGIFFYHLLQKIFYNQIDETLLEERSIIVEFINHADSVPDFRTVFGHNIEVTILNTPQRKVERIHDTTMYSREEGDFQSYRHLFTENTSIKKQGYTIEIFKPLRETEILTAEIFIAVTLLFIVLLILLVAVNYFIARRAWIPFYRTLQNLSGYDINQEAPLKLTDTHIHEFILLNKTLEKMSKKIREDFLNLKEFNENAAHELQTPLAVIKSKLDLLIQDERLTHEQMQLISSVYEATSRMSKLNQGLLLISKIENRQFAQAEEVDIFQIIQKNLTYFEEIILLKKIKVNVQYLQPVRISMNKTLAEILISNLLSNAIKHNLVNGSIDIRQDHASLTISNTGPVMSSDPSYLFNRFRKSDHSSDSVGLGLSIVRKITDHYGFQIEYLVQDRYNTLKLSF